MRAIPLTQTQDNYADAVTFGGRDVYVAGEVNVANASAYMRMIYGRVGAASPGPEILVAPKVGIPLAATDLQGRALMGVQFRSAVAGTPATVWGVLYNPGDPTAIGGTQFSGTVTQSGQVSGTVIGCQVRQSVGQAVASSAVGPPSTIMTWDLEDFDPNNMHDPAVAPSRVTIPTAAGGYWRFDGFVGIAATGVQTTVMAALRKNGATSLQWENYSANGAAHHGAYVSCAALMSVNDYVELLACQDAGAFNSDPASSYLRATFIGSG